MYLNLYFLTFIFFIYFNNCCCQKDFCNDVFFSNDVIQKCKETDPSILITEHVNLNYKNIECKVKFYAYLIDELFSQGLDLEMQFRSEYRDNTIITDTTFKLNELIDTSMIKYRAQKKLYFIFIEVNKSYKQNCSGFYEVNLPQYELICQNIIKYGIFKNPQYVKLFLSNKYATVDIKRYYDFIRTTRKRNE